MITVFTIPKPFLGDIAIIQKNAIKSWSILHPNCEVFLFGDEFGIAEVAKEVGVNHVPSIKKNEYGTPILNSAFNLAEKMAKNNILVYINADIILMSDFISAVQKNKKTQFLMSGRRWDLDIKEEINFDDFGWEKKILNKIKKEGKLHGYSGIDYFVFPKNLPYILPDFAVGRIGWDNWLIYCIKKLKISIIDATEAITAIHQNHGFFHSKFGNERSRRVEGPELERNIKLAGGLTNMCTLRDADWILTKKSLQRPKLSRRIFSSLSIFYPWRLLLSFKRRFQQFLKWRY